LRIYETDIHRTDVSGHQREDDIGIPENLWVIS